MSQRGVRMLEEPCQELFEDHLGAALIKPGDSVIIRKKRCVGNFIHTIRVEPR